MKSVITRFTTLRVGPRQFVLIAVTAAGDAPTGFIFRTRREADAKAASLNGTAA